MINRDNTGITLRSRAKTQLKDILYLCENNYSKVKSLLPQLEEAGRTTFLLPEGDINSRVTLSTYKESKHTSLLEINQSSFFNSRTIATKIEVVIYHDLKMVEVRKFNGKRQFWARNKYPNKNMFHKDEKFQWNKFLSEWLEFSKKEGLADIYIELERT